MKHSTLRSSEKRPILWQQKNDHQRKDHYTSYQTEKFYKTGIKDTSDPNHPDFVIESYYFHVRLVADLALELTRAGNYIIEQVRAQIAANYRSNEGALLINWELPSQTSYKTVEKDRLYPGLEEFMTMRSSRDVSQGMGLRSEYEVFFQALASVLMVIFPTEKANHVDWPPQISTTNSYSLLCLFHLLSQVLRQCIFVHHH
ncbi:MAG: hypothetical protein ACI84C_000395 [Flavobacteriales bacterium]|jgi:hypothetical protein